MILSVLWLSEAIGGKGEGRKLCLRTATDYSTVCIHYILVWSPDSGEV